MGIRPPTQEVLGPDGQSSIYNGVPSPPHTRLPWQGRCSGPGHAWRERPRHLAPPRGVAEARAALPGPEEAPGPLRRPLILTWHLSQRGDRHGAPRLPAHGHSGLTAGWRCHAVPAPRLPAPGARLLPEVVTQHTRPTGGSTLGTVPRQGPSAHSTSGPLFHLSGGTQSFRTSHNTTVGG